MGDDVPIPMNHSLDVWIHGVVTMTGVLTGGFSMTSNKSSCLYLDALV